MEPEGDLLHVVGACRSPPRLAGCLYGREQQADEHADDGDDHKEFDKGEPAMFQATSHDHLQQILLGRCGRRATPLHF